MKIRLWLLTVVLIVGIWGLEIGIDHFLIETGSLQEFLKFKRVSHDLFVPWGITLAILFASLLFYRAFARQKKTLDQLSAAHEKLSLREDQLRKVIRKLRALNQQLQVGLQQMEVKNLQLQTSEQRLQDVNAELLESKSQFQKMADNVPGVVYQFLVSPDGAMSFPFVSEKCRDMIGISAEAIQQDSATVFGFIHPDDRALFYANIMDSAKTFKPWHWEGRFLVCGTMKWLKGAAEPERHPDGSILWDGLMIDVTDFKRAEQALQQSKQMLQLVLDSIPSGVFWKDRDSIYLGCNRVLALDAGLAATASIIHKTDMDLIWREQAQQFRADDRQVMETNTPKLDFEEPLIKADRSRYWVRTSKIPMRDPEGHVIGVLGTYEDITKRKKAEEQLRLQGEIIKNMAEGVVVTRVSDATIVYTNPKFEEMFGYGAGELIGKHVSVLNAPTDRNPLEVARDIQDVLGKKGSWQGDVCNIRKNGTSFWCRANVSTFEHPWHGGVWIAVHEDITERKKTEGLIRASLREKEVLLKEIHHRVKNNLQIVSSLLSLQSQYIADPRTRQLFRESQTRMRTMALIHEKLYQSRDLAQTHFAGYLRQLTEELLRSHRVHDIQIHVEVEDHIRLGIDTAIPCALIIHELVSNALKYAFTFPAPAAKARKSRNEIHVVFREEPGAGFLLIVRDNGVGLPPHIKPGQTQSLGWHLIAALTEQIHGRLEITRKAGTAVQIRLPEVKSKPPVIAALAEPEEL